MNINCNYKNTAFKGRLKLIGDATQCIKNAYYGNKTLRELAKGDYDIIGKIKSRNADDHEIYKQGKDEVLYKFSLTARKKVNGLLKNIIEFFNIRPVIKPTKNCHSEETTINIINSLNDINALKKELNIKS